MKVGGARGGSPSASWLRSLCGVARAGGDHPRGHACGDPPRKGREERPFIYCPTGSGRAASGGFRFDLLSQRKRPALLGRPPAGFFHSLPSPAATGPEGGTRRLFRALRWVDGRAPLAMSGTEFERTTVSMRVNVGAASAAMGVCRGLARCRGIAAEAAPTRARDRSELDARPIS